MKNLLLLCFSIIVFLSYSQPRIEVLWGGNNSDSVLYYGVSPLIKVIPGDIDINEIEVNISGNGILKPFGTNSYKIELLSKNDIYISLKRKGKRIAHFRYKVEEQKD